ncbi:hypothetical protein C5O22_11405 [Treponema sp. J25]|nr:hypothetical protein C5O22_11405 [Treponema sp. J25]
MFLSVFIAYYTSIQILWGGSYMNRYWYVGLGILLTGLINIAAAQDATSLVLTEEDAVVRATVHNISLLRFQNTLEAKKRAVDRSFNSFLPSVTVGVGAIHSNEASYDLAKWNRYGSLKTSLSLSVGTFYDIETIKQQYEAQKISYEQAKKSLELSVRKYFKGLLLAEENLQLLSQNLQTAQKNYEEVLKKQKVGLASETEALSALVTVENLKPRLVSARASYVNQLETLKQLIGIESSVVVTLQGKLERPNTTKLADLTRLLKEASPSPDEQSLRSQLIVAEMNRKATVASTTLPSLSFSWTYQPTAGGTTSNWVDQGSLSIALNWSVDSLLPFSSAGESRDTLMDTIRDLHYQIEDARKNAELTRSSYVREIEQYLTALESYQANERLAQRSLELTQLAYNNGLADFISVQNAADDLAEVRYSILEYTYNLSITLLNLEYSLGLPFGTLGR